MDYKLQKYTNLQKRKSQAMLVAILMVTAAALAIGIAIATVSSSQINISVSSRDSNRAYGLAEGCLENALMRLARTDMTVPPPFTTAQGSCTIEISGVAPKLVTAYAQVGKARRAIRATLTINNEVLNIVTWQETY